MHSRKLIHELISNCATRHTRHHASTQYNARMATDVSHRRWLLLALGTQRFLCRTRVCVRACMRAFVAIPVRKRNIVHDRIFPPPELWTDLSDAVIASGFIARHGLWARSTLPLRCFVLDLSVRTPGAAHTCEDFDNPSLVC